MSVREEHGNPLARFARRVLADYEIYHIYRLDLLDRSCEKPAGIVLSTITDAAALKLSPDAELQNLWRYAGDDAFGYSASIGGEFAGVCWYWAGERYRRERNFWPLEPDEAKLIQITTAERFRGRGLAYDLIRFGAQQIAKSGFHRAYARIWHSNHPSIRLFEKAGWRRVSLVANIRPRGRARNLRIVIPTLRGGERR